MNDFFGVQEEEEDSNLTPAQKEQIERINAVKSKISKILQSSNIEIIDENIGDEYESGGGAAKEFNQQEYDALNTGFSQKNKTKVHYCFIIACISASAMLYSKIV